MRIYQPSTGAVACARADLTGGIWRPKYITTWPNSNTWHVNRGRFVFNEPVVIQVGRYNKPQPREAERDSEIAKFIDLPQYWKWSGEADDSHVDNGYFNCDREIGTETTDNVLLISMISYENKNLAKFTTGRTFGWDSHVTCYSMTGSKQDIMWSLKCKYINTTKDKNYLKIKFDKQFKSNNHYMTKGNVYSCLLYTSPSPRDRQKSRMPSSA